MGALELIHPTDCDKIELNCLKSDPEINQFAVARVRVGRGSSFFPKPFFKTLKFQRCAKNLGKHLQFFSNSRGKPSGNDSLSTFATIRADKAQVIAAKIQRSV